MFPGMQALPGCLSALASAPEQQGQATAAALEMVATFLSNGQGQLVPTQATLASEHILPAVAQILDAQAKLEREGLLPEECKLRGPQRPTLLEKLFAGMGKLLLPYASAKLQTHLSHCSTGGDMSFWEDCLLLFQGLRKSSDCMRCCGAPCELHNNPVWLSVGPAEC